MRLRIQMVSHTFDVISIDPALSAVQLAQALAWPFVIRLHRTEEHDLFLLQPTKQASQVRRRRQIAHRATSIVRQSVWLRSASAQRSDREEIALIELYVFCIVHLRNALLLFSAHVFPPQQRHFCRQWKTVTCWTVGIGGRRLFSSRVATVLCDRIERLRTRHAAVLNLLPLSKRTFYSDNNSHIVRCVVAVEVG